MASTRQGSSKAPHHTSSMTLTTTSRTTSIAPLVVVSGKDALDPLLTEWVGRYLIAEPYPWLILLLLFVLLLRQAERKQVRIWLQGTWDPEQYMPKVKQSQMVLFQSWAEIASNA